MRKTLIIFIAALVAAAALAADFDAETASKDELLQATDAAFNAGDDARAAELLLVADRRWPGDEKISGWLVQYYADTRQLEKALGVVATYCQAHPEDADWTYGKAQMELDLGRYAEALATINKYLAANPDAADAYVWQGNIYMRSTAPDYAEAAAAYEEALKRIPAEERPAFAYVLYNLGCCYARGGDAPRALRNLNEAVACDPLLGASLAGDADLASLRGSAEFDALAKEAAARAAAAEVEKMTVKPGEAAPAFKLADLRGGEHALAEFKGKSLVLNIWATWCPPCRAEIPDLVAFTTAHPDVAVVGISVDAPNADLAGFVSDYQINYLVLKDDGATAPKYLGEHGGIPQTYFIDKDGVVRGHIYGSTNFANFEAHLEALQPNGK